MSAAWANLDAEAALYLRPAGLVPAPFARTGALQIAGGWTACASLHVIARNLGERVVEELVPASLVDDFRAGLSDEHQVRFDQLLANMTASRAALDFPNSGMVLALNQPRVMGILNVTPDSFSDGGKFVDADAAIVHAKSMAQAGADILDIGGRSTRPGAKPVWEGDEKERVIPVLNALRTEGIPLSVDTRRAAVMDAALDAGVHMINDVSALTYDDDSIRVAAEGNTPVVLMHALGEPGTMQDAPTYSDVLLDVFDFLEERVGVCVDAGISKDRIIVDPGIGFGKTVHHNLMLLNGLSTFHTLGCAVMLGASRKRFIGALSNEENAESRLGGSLASLMTGVQQGVQLFRVHDVAESVQALAVSRGMSDSAALWI